jgi:uncharacterized protein YbaP (TraB family)
MKLSIYTLIAFLFFHSCATKDVQQIGNEDILQKNEKSLLWKIEGEQIETSYLFGTMHLINKSLFNFTEQLTNKIKESDEVVMEVGGKPDPMLLVSLLRLDSGTVEQFFTTEEFKEVKAFLDDEANVSNLQYNMIYSKMKPFLLLQAVSQAYFEKNPESYDLTIMDKAKKYEKPLYGLETYEQQVGFFNELSDQKVADMVLESVRNYEKEKKDMLYLMELYANQRVDKLIPLIKKQSPELMEFEELFLKNRNIAWVPQLIEEMSTKKCFIAVGAAHLFDEHGLIELLLAAGLTVTAIEMTND